MTSEGAAGEAADAEFADRLDAALEQLWGGDSSAFQQLAGSGEIPGLLASPPSGLWEQLLPGSTLDRYRIIRRIGRGGMGIVYEAEQDHPARRVALKLIRSGAYADEFEVRLFQREARSLARLEHPGIATLHDAGFADGLHYLVMELVRGEPLDVWAARADLGRADRLELFLLLCEAVAYAHRRGVLHRDLKPSNVLVAEGGRPRVLDFGLARIVGTDGDDDTIVTRTGQRQGTLPYMAPEQVLGDRRCIDARVDVYALGLLLYQLLTSRLPYDLPEDSSFEAARIIAEQPPERPSCHAGGIAADLDTILLKALEKDPERRYESVAALASDLRAFHEQRPISARPPGLLYRLRKYVARNRIPVLAAGVALTGLVAGLVVSLLALSAARASERAARLEARKASVVSEFLSNILSGADPELEGREDVQVREVLDRATLRIDSGEVTDGEPEAAVRGMLGRSYRGLGLYTEARAHLERAYVLHQEQHDGPHPDLALGLRDLGILEHTLTNYEAAEDLLRRALEMRRELLGDEHQDTFQSRNDLGWLLHNLVRLDVAEQLFRENVRLARAEQPLNVEWLNYQLTELGDFLVQADQGEVAYQILEEASRLEVGDPRRKARTLEILGTSLTTLGRTEEAIAVLSQSLEYRRAALGEEHLDTARSLYFLGKVHSVANQLSQAEEYFRAALAIRKRRLGERHVQVFTSSHAVANVLLRLSRPREALPIMLSTIGQMEATQGPAHKDVGRAYLTLAQAHMNAGESQDAIAAATRGIEILEPKFGPEDRYVREARKLIRGCSGGQ